MTETGPLHLPDLYIEGFRSIDKLSIPRLGCVTLLAGKNAVGKTTVLDAVRVYAARGSHAALRELLEGHEEVIFDASGNERIATPDVGALFYGRDDSLNSHITIGPKCVSDRLCIDLASSDDVWEFIQQTQPALFSEFWDADGIQAVKVTFKDASQTIPLGFPVRGWRRSDRSEIRCESIGPDVLPNRELTRLWDNVALTDDETIVIDSLNLIAGNGVKGDAVVGVHAPEYDQRGRRVMVRLKSHRRPIPLRSLGDGAVRMFGAALALANSRDGFLLIDEVENGIHHSIQHDFWRMVLQTAQANNVQVLATTHSWDCVAGFARAVLECEDVEGVLVRIERYRGESRAVMYSEKNLRVAAEQDIEVR